MSDEPTYGRPADDFPHNGLNGWGLGSRVTSRLTGVVGVAVGAVLGRGDLDASNPKCWIVSVRIQNANGYKGRVSLPFEEVEPA